MVYETKIFCREYYTILDELDQEITFASESVFSFHERYTAIRAWKRIIILVSKTLDYTFYRKNTITKSWLK